MMLPSSVLLALLAVLPANADGLYPKKSPVLNLNQKTYNSLIANSNYTSVSQFPVAPATLQLTNAALLQIVE